MNAPKIACPACRADMALVLSEQQGYRDDGQVFGIFQCSSCGSMGSWPRTVPEGLYDLIYEQAPRIPGYERYEEYATLASRSATPLAALADREDMYWGVASALSALGGPGTVRRVLDVGCGLGYLTFALSRAGYEAHGLDASGKAIASARTRFGELFSVGTVAGFAATSSHEWTAAILAEVLEHVADPSSLLAEVWRLVAPGGGLVVTTPNRSASPPDVVWDTDPPPVHLSWFSEAGLRALGDSLGAETTFVDFTEFSVSHPTWRPRTPSGRATRGSMLAADGSALPRPFNLGGLGRGLQRLPGGRALFALSQVLRGRRLLAGPRRDTAVAILRRPG